MSEYRVIVCGSRGWKDRLRLYKHLDVLKTLHGSELVIIHGKCQRGADRMADDWCRSRGVAQVAFPADWSLGRQAGYVRNIEMAQSDPKPNLCLAFWDGTSRGTKNMIDVAESEGIDVGIFT